MTFTKRSLLTHQAGLERAVRQRRRVLSNANETLVIATTPLGIPLRRLSLTLPFQAFCNAGKEDPPLYCNESRSQRPRRPEQIRKRSLLKAHHQSQGAGEGEEEEEGDEVGLV